MTAVNDMTKSVTFAFECPICWRGVTETHYGCIRGHTDTAGNRCKASSHPIDIATKLAPGEKPRRP